MGVKNAPEMTARQLGPWTRVVETGLKGYSQKEVTAKAGWKPQRLYRTWPHICNPALASTLDLLQVLIYAEEVTRIDMIPQQQLLHA